MGKIKKLKTDNLEDEVKRKNEKSNEIQKCSSSDSNDSLSFSSSSSQQSDYEENNKKRKKNRKSKKTKLKCTLITETISTIENKIGVCPECEKIYNGRTMICCDKCSEWYHMGCQGITVEPKDEESWFCKRCETKEKN